MISEKKKKKPLSLIGRILPYYKSCWKTVVLDLFCACLTTVCEIVLPLIVKEITSAATEDLSLLTKEFIWKFGLLYILLRLIDVGANYYMTAVGHIMGCKIETGMRSDLFAHLEKMSFSYYDNTKVGSLMSRITNDLFEVTEFAHHCPEEMMIAGIKIICSFILLSGMNLKLTLIMFSVIPVMCAILILFRLRMRSNFKESKVRLAELNARIEDSLLGIRIVKSFTNENVEQKKFDDGNGHYLDIKRRRYVLMADFHSATRLFEGVMYIVVVICGGLFLINGEISAAEYVAYLMFVNTLLSSVRRIVEFSEQFHEGMTGIERFSEIMDTEPEIQDCKNAIELTDVQGDVEFRDVSFRYESDTVNVLEHLNLHVRAGENIAFVGPSGGGKSTLCSLIPRFYETTDGSVRIDGKDVKTLTQKSLRDQIGVVAQDVYLFSGTIRENISYGKPGATDEEIQRAAKLAGADEFIVNLPNGYDSYVGERGVKLSGGQKQRISIARVFLKNPPILILDEATSSLDNESEHLVQQSLEKLAQGRTTFTVAHRLTTVKNADRIIVLTEHGIEEEGTHKALLEKGGLYAELYHMYSEK